MLNLDFPDEVSKKTICPLRHLNWAKVLSKGRDKKDGAAKVNPLSSIGFRQSKHSVIGS